MQGNIGESAGKDPANTSGSISGKVKTRAKSEKKERESTTEKFGGGPHAEALQETTDRGKMGYELMPARYRSWDKYDDIAAAKLEMVKDNRPFGDVMASDKDVKWILRKKQESKKKMFDQWLLRVMDKPNSMELAHAIKKNFPEIIAARVEEAHDAMKTQERLLHMRVTPPHMWTREDYILLYLIMSGEVPIPDYPIYAPERRGASKAKLFERGLLNPRRWRTEEPVIIPTEIMGLIGQLNTGTYDANKTNGMTLAGIGEDDSMRSLMRNLQIK